MKVSEDKIPILLVFASLLLFFFQSKIFGVFNYVFMTIAYVIILRTSKLFQTKREDLFNLPLSKNEFFIHCLMIYSFRPLIILNMLVVVIFNVKFFDPKGFSAVFIVISIFLSLLLCVSIGCMRTFLILKLRHEDRFTLSSNLESLRTISLGALVILLFMMFFSMQVNVYLLSLLLLGCIGLLSSFFYLRVFKNLFHEHMYYKKLKFNFLYDLPLISLFLFYLLYPDADHLTKQVKTTLKITTEKVK